MVDWAALGENMEEYRKTEEESDCKVAGLPTKEGGIGAIRKLDWLGLVLTVLWTPCKLP